MSTFAKVMVVVNFILAIAFLAAAGTLHGAAESWKGKYNDLEKAKDQQIQNLDGQVKARGQELEEARAQQRALEGRAAAAEAVQKQQAESNSVLMKEIDVKNGEISKLQANLTDATNAVKDQTARNEQLSTALAQKDADQKATAEKLRTSEELAARETQRADNAERSLGAAEVANKKATDDLDSANTALAVYRKKFGALGEAPVSAVKGVVQAASASDDVFVVSVGSKDGVKVGYEFTVSRGDKYVSTIVIDSVFPNHAAGHTKQGMKKLDVQAGDSVATATGL